MEESGCIEEQTNNSKYNCRKKNIYLQKMSAGVVLKIAKKSWNYV